MQAAADQGSSSAPPSASASVSASAAALHAGADLRDLPPVARLVASEVNRNSGPRGRTPTLQQMTEALANAGAATVIHVRREYVLAVDALAEHFERGNSNQDVACDPFLSLERFDPVDPADNKSLLPKLTAEEMKNFGAELERLLYSQCKRKFVRKSTDKVAHGCGFSFRFKCGRAG